MRLPIFLSLLSTPLLAADHTVATPEELRAALPKLADGDSLKIAPGEYPGGHHVSGIARLTVTALDPAKPPVFVGGGNAWHFSRCPGLTLTHLHARGQTG
ncbi:MAG: hypothetical protein KDL87_18080, partial [Verrucomicrobiae bacterium]|nr:hypothetical protein [Verrucomicrobiae bacterium]